MALLLTCLPNLSTVYAHVPWCDPVLEAITEQTITVRAVGIYQRLFAIPKELYLFHDIPVIHRDTHENSEVSEEDTDEVEQDKNRFALRFDNL